ncbi:UDP-N-acetylglucosamine transferase subunit [Arachnomyces sp. PD_36]|nr:UDP-N-acetylglucosamine transferase subunit [Arachnomyces sp. PD_36]
MFPLTDTLSLIRDKPLAFSILLITTTVAAILVNIFFVRLFIQTFIDQPRIPQRRRKHSPTHLLIVLGSGGHTAEMISMLQRAPLDPALYTHRTYVVSSGDSFSAQKAVEFEENLALRSRGDGKEERSTYGGDAAADIDPQSTKNLGASSHPSSAAKEYTVVTVPRARRVHQSFLTAPFSTLHCFWSCLCVLRGKHPGQRGHPTYPDLILTNGPATAVCVIVAAKLLRLFHCTLNPRSQINEDGQPGNRAPSAALRTIFIESWARVTTLSLSGKIVLPLVDRFLVQWAGLDGRTGWDANWIIGRGNAPKRAEYVGALVG